MIFARIENHFSEKFSEKKIKRKIFCWRNKVFEAQFRINNEKHIEIIDVFYEKMIETILKIFG